MIDIIVVIALTFFTVIAVTMDALGRNVCK
jgi:hypothetical protein